MGHCHGLPGDPGPVNGQCTTQPRVLILLAQSLQDMLCVCPFPGPAARLQPALDTPLSPPAQEYSIVQPFCCLLGPASWTVPGPEMVPLLDSVSQGLGARLGPGGSYSTRQSDWPLVTTPLPFLFQIEPQFCRVSLAGNLRLARASWVEEEVESEKEVG